jgi:hypothetical protein
MLLTKEVTTKISGNVTYYYINNNIDVEFNQLIKLDINKLNPNSHIIVDAVCDVCGKEVKVQYRRYNQSIKKGGYYTCSSACSKEKKENYFLEKYGEKTPFKSEVIKEKIKKTFQEKYGEEHFRKSDIWRSENVTKEVEKRKKTIFDIFLRENNVVVGQTESEFLVKCDIHGINPITKKIFSNRKRIKTELCPICKPINSNVSGKETLLFKLINELYCGKIVQNFKIERQEIDIYIPELNLGFEFNGLFWHSELYKPNDYHQNKTVLCEKNGIRLIHIYEDDFDNKLEIIKSLIKNILGYSTKIPARKTEVRMLNTQEIKKFLEKNHLQGYTPSSINLGLYYESNLVSVMSFSKMRGIFRNKKQDNNYELVRFCNILDTSVIGGASKMFNHFIRNYNPNSVMSYCDISWATGRVYENMGMKLIGITKPNYYYIINHNRESRIKYQKHKLVKDGFDIKKTESQIMLERGYYRIYNSGNKKFIYTKNPS